MKKKCPVCKKQFNSLQKKKWLPFCSERCQLIDLGDWFSERHKIASDSEAPISYKDEDHSTKH